MNNNFTDMATEWNNFAQKPSSSSQASSQSRSKCANDENSGTGWGNPPDTTWSSNNAAPTNSTSWDPDPLNMGGFDAPRPTLRPIRGSGNAALSSPNADEAPFGSRKSSDPPFEFARRQLADSFTHIVRASPHGQELFSGGGGGGSRNSSGSAPATHWGDGCGGGDDEYRQPSHLRAEDSLLAKLLRTKLRELSDGPAAKYDVEVERRQNTEHPLHSVYDFKDLPLVPELLKGIFAQGFARPSKIQETALPIILMPDDTGEDGVRYRNLIAQSQSGTGKTAAFAVGILQRIDLSATEGPAQALILAPTYELALQIGGVIQSIGQYMQGLRVAFAVRRSLSDVGTGQGSYPRNQLVRAHVIVGTPGTVLHWIRDRMIDPSAIRMFVLDEADVMIDQQGHKATSIRIHRFLDKVTCQFLLFSATYETEVMDLAQAIIPDPHIVLRLRRKEETLDNIQQYYIPCCNDRPLGSMAFGERRELIFGSKIAVLCQIFGAFHIGQCIIFCHSKSEAAAISQTLVESGHSSVAMLTADLSVDQRAAVIERFKSGQHERVLVATNVLARGIDIESVTMVINFNVPRKYLDVSEGGDNNEGFGVGGDNRPRARATGDPDYETYLHRIGRTGRFGRKGISFILIDAESDRSNEYAMVKALEEHYGRPIVKLDPENQEEFEICGSY